MRFCGIVGRWGRVFARDAPFEALLRRAPQGEVENFETTSHADLMLRCFAKQSLEACAAIPSLHHLRLHQIPLFPMQHGIEGIAGGKHQMKTRRMPVNA